MRAVLMISLLFTAACQSAAPTAIGEPGHLQGELAGRIAGPAQACVSALPNQGPRVIDSMTIALDVGSTVWVNRLSASCPALSPFNSLIVERSGGQICRGDRVRGLEPGATIPGPSCNLQDWVPHRRP